ncbi:cytochrome c3 family protein [Terriglobus sp. RCC_193]|uniref:cytochrome c3 family protein n=1 Tax=Terriglobus sp. RCC_193 TaxID=3239218 RepID=UPI0035266556
MKKLLLAIALMFAFALGAHAQDDSMGAPPQNDAAQVASPADVAKASAPTVTGNTAPGQPINFNHQLHVGTAKLQCNDCHEPNRGGATLAIPQPSKCMLCHAAIATDKPDIKHLADAAKNNELIQWVRVYRVPSFVTFSHKTHTSAGATCEACHGPVAQRTAIAEEKNLHMAGCISCHQQVNAPATCDTCHAIMSKNGQSPFDADKTVLARLHVPMASAHTVVADMHRSLTDSLAATATSSVAIYLRAPAL